MKTRFKDKEEYCLPSGLHIGSVLGDSGNGLYSPNSYSIGK